MFRKGSQPGACAEKHQSFISLCNVWDLSLLSVHVLKTVTIFSAKNNPFILNRRKLWGSGDWGVSGSSLRKIRIQ